MYTLGVNNNSVPNLVIVAGPNGAGKSTIADFLTANRSISRYINADVIARGMAAGEADGSDIGAGRVLLKLVKEAVSKRESFAFESTMSGLLWKNLIQEAQNIGYEVTICYVAVSSEDISLERIRQRVKEGGHNIPQDTVKRRYKKSLSRFLNSYRHKVDHWCFFDNSGRDAMMIAACTKSNELIFEPEIWREYERR